jgi:hypothetical protein
MNVLAISLGVPGRRPEANGVGCCGKRALLCLGGVCRKPFSGIFQSKCFVLDTNTSLGLLCHLSVSHCQSVIVPGCWERKPDFKKGPGNDRDQQCLFIPVNEASLETAGARAGIWKHQSAWLALSLPNGD